MFDAGRGPGRDPGNAERDEEKAVGTAKGADPVRLSCCERFGDESRLIRPTDSGERERKDFKDCEESGLR